MPFGEFLGAPLPVWGGKAYHQAMARPLVGVIMGSDSDLPVMAEVPRILAELGIDCETTIVSAHRTPARLVEYARAAAARGLEVIVAGAGGAAHLPGMTASMTTLPVIGVPVRTKTLDGLDSLLSIVQMPSGVPVATVAVDGARNAGLLAARILALSRPALARELADYAARKEAEVLAKARKLEETGPEAYGQSLP
jgi:5-(carboxyamino)imidazole ribonucleotide mutase